jgi:NhaP-type Na+/H+ or K+/H+ antiporter
VTEATTGLVYLVAGVGLLLAGALPRLLSRRAFSSAMVFVGVGALAALLPIDLPLRADQHRAATERLTEVCVIVALMGVGLALDRPFAWRSWATTWRLLAVAMPVFIAATAVLGWWVLGLAPAAALLLGAALAPTDPVLASDVQVGEPTDDPDSEDEVRFSLTSEAGLNDGLAFPFVTAAILLATAPVTQWWGHWLAWDLVGKVLVGCAVGVAVGWLLARIAFRAPTEALRFAQAAESVVALAAVFLAYGAAELVGGYGFLAVFAAALAIRARERDHEYHVVLHEFIGQLERLLTLGLLLLLGYGLATGLLAALTWQVAVVAVLLIVVVRPAVGRLSLARSRPSADERRAIAFFGVRGIGSFYYLSYALGEAELADADLLWATVSFTVLVSIVVHGVTASPVLRRIDRRHGRSTPEPA